MTTKTVAFESTLNLGKEKSEFTAVTLFGCKSNTHKIALNRGHSKLIYTTQQ